MREILNKIVVIGDIHGRRCWRNIVGDDADLYVFLGDYVSTHEGVDSQTQIDNLMDILHFKEENKDRVILLRGNHDMQHLGYRWAECSGLFEEVKEEMSKQPFRKRFLRDTQWVFRYNGIIFSHAGISERWFDDSGVAAVGDINSLAPSELFGFRPCKMSDYYGISNTQGPTWIRPQTLIEYALPGYTYVVGHTTVKNIFDLKEKVFTKYSNELSDSEKERVCSIWLCDALPNEYLVIENGVFKSVKL